MKNFNFSSSNSKKLILLALDWTRPKDPPLSLGHASILANLIDKNVPVSSLSYSVNDPDFSPDKVSDEIMNHAGSGDLAIGAFVWNEKATQKILNNLKERNFPGRVIIGGPQVSYVKRGIEKYYPQADIFVRGYAENALVELMQSKESQPEIAGVHYANSSDRGLSAEVDLEKLPSPYLNKIIPPQRFIRFETQRGCPFSCSFCQHRESDVTKTRRNFNLSRVLKEVDWITENKVIQDVAVLDPTFNSGPQYLDVMERFIDGKFSGKLALQIRLEMIKPEFLDLVSRLNESGRVVLEAGIQTTNKDEQKLIQRPNNMTKVVNALDEIKRRNIEVETSLIFGLPGQTINSFQESIDFCKKMDVDKIYAFPLMLLRGTPLHAMKEILNLKESDEINLEKINRLQTDIPHVISSNSFNNDDWKKMSEIAQNLESYNNRKEVLKPSTSTLLKEVKTLGDKENSVSR